MTTMTLNDKEITLYGGYLVMKNIETNSKPITKLLYEGVEGTLATSDAAIIVYSCLKEKSFTLDELVEIIGNAAVSDVDKYSELMLNCFSVLGFKNKE